MEKTGSLSYVELHSALRALVVGDIPGVQGVQSIDSILGAIIGHAEAHREPEYIPGEIYQDAKGRRLIRVDHNSPWPWRVLSFVSGDIPEGAEYYLEEFPERPLRRLVPEADGGA